jgi:hypothetical protein
MSKTTGTPEQTAKCKGCGAHLRAPRSISRGYSDRCWKLRKVRAIEAAIAPYSPAQQDKALALMGSGGIRPTSNPRVWLADSSDGKTVYMIRDGRCECQGARRGCYHEAGRAGAVAVLQISQAA